MRLCILGGHELGQLVMRHHHGERGRAVVQDVWGEQRQEHVKIQIEMKQEQLNVFRVHDQW